MITILTISDKADWQEVLSRFARVDAYQSVGYNEACEFTDGGQAILLVVEHGQDTAALPLLIQTVPGNSRLSHASSAYGYPGVLATGVAPGLSDEVKAGMIAIKGAFGVVSVSLRLDPFCAENAVVTSFMNCRTVGPSVYLDLRQSAEHQWREAQTNHKRNFRRTDREHRPVLLVDESFEHLPEFVRLYASTMQRNNADASYFFPYPYFSSLAAGCRGMMTLFHAEVAGEIVSSALMVDSGNVVHYHLGGTREGWEARGVSRWLLEVVRRHYTEAGRSVLHLGGGRGGRQDSLFGFKKGFGGDLIAVRVSTLIVQPDVYRELAARSPSDRPSSFPAFEMGTFPRARPAEGHKAL